MKYLVGAIIITPSTVYYTVTNQKRSILVANTLADPNEDLSIKQDTDFEV